MQVRFGWLYVVGLSGLLSCRSEQAVFSFSPLVLSTPPAPAPRREPSATAAPAAPSPGAAPASQPATKPAVAAATPKRAPRLLRRVAAEPAAAEAAAATVAAPVVARPARWRQRRASWAGAPARTTEAGLGRTVLFLLAVVLGALAGLAALLSLIPGVSFWGGLGLAVGGLLGLGLLYKLLSGGKKKR